MSTASPHAGLSKLTHTRYWVIFCAATLSVITYIDRVSISQAAPLITEDLGLTTWSSGVDGKGQPIPAPEKHPQLNGALVSPNQGGATNWQPPSFSPKTGLFYTDATKAYSVYYIYDPSDNPLGWGGTDRGGYSTSSVRAIDYKTGEIRWSHEWGGTIRAGLLSTAGNLVFAGDSGGNLVALNATTGDALWHANLGNLLGNGPISYELDQEQYLIVGAGDTLFGFVMHTDGR